MDYFAFISYKHQDEKWAVWLQRKLERYKLPTALCREKKIPRRLKPVFRDKTDLSCCALIQDLHEKLNNSRYLIVICSPNAVSSPYIDEEIRYFASTHSKEYIIPFIVSGTPYSCDGYECYPTEIRYLFPKVDLLDEDQEILGANIGEKESGSLRKRKERAFIMVLSYMLEITFDSLWRRHHKYMVRKHLSYIVTLCLMFLVPYVVWSRTHSFDVEFSLTERVPVNEKLPAPTGELTLICGSDTLTKEIDLIYDKVVFKDMPGKYKERDAEVSVNLFGFIQKDTLIKISEVISVELQRDEACFGHIEGVVRDKNDAFVDEAVIGINGIEVISGPDGFFSINIPLELQSPFYNASIKHGDNVTFVEGICPMQYNELIINTLYIY